MTRKVYKEGKQLPYEMSSSPSRLVPARATLHNPGAVALSLSGVVAAKVSSLATIPAQPHAHLRSVPHYATGETNVHT